MSQKVMELVAEINTARSNKSSSVKDEVRVMQSMLNDNTFKVDVYGKNGVESTYSPYEESRAMIGSIIKDTTKISSEEANELANTYKFDKQNSAIMVGLAKEFVNTYIETGRKLPLGARATSNISISKKVKEAREAGPKKIGVNDDGTDKIIQGSGIIPAHGSLKVYSPCPSYLK